MQYFYTQNSCCLLKAEDISLRGILFKVMIATLADFFKGINEHLGVFILSMTPIVELRASIPVGLLAYKLPVLETLALSVAGNMLPVLIILKYLEPIRDFFTSRIKWMDRLYKHITEKTHTKHSAKFMAVGAIFLVTFIAIPLPGTGAWTGCLIAYLFEVPYWKAIGLIFLGVFGAAVIVTGLTMGIDVGINSILNLLSNTQ